MIPVWEQPWWVERAVRPYENTDDDYEWMVKYGVRFDCRKLNEDFLLHSGEEMIAELNAGGQLPKQPAINCVYQFANSWVMLSEGEYHVQVGALSSATVPYLNAYWARADPGPEDDLADGNVEIWDRDSWAKLLNSGAQEGEYQPAFYIGIGDQSADDDAVKAMRVTMLALGVLTLLSERLLRERAIKGASLTKNARRQNKGLVPVLDYRVVTLNLAETRRRARQAKLHRHESPMLHWRRGHWRTLGRMSEFEKRTWIKRCLVGDPDKGFVAKHYRAIWQPTIH